MYMTDTKVAFQMFTCVDVAIVKRYFQIMASWLTTIILKDHDNPSVGNRIITPRAAELENSNSKLQMDA